MRFHGISKTSLDFKSEISAGFPSRKVLHMEEIKLDVTR
jgi:hypothetical protein